MFKFYIFTIAAVISTIHASNIQFSRNVTTKFLCGKEHLPDALVYTKAVGKHDDLHYLATTLGVPSMLAALTDKDIEPVVDCKNISVKNKTLSFTKPPKYVFGVAFNRLLEYNDKADKANLDKLGQNSTDWNVTDLSNHQLKWNTTLDTDQNIVHWTLQSNSTLLKFLPGGYLSISLQFFGSEGESEILPHEKYTANSTQIHVVLDHLMPNYASSRFALEFTIFSNDSKEQVHNTLVTHKSIDDEHTPGVFQLVDWQVENKRKSSFGSVYAQWKPVCYIADPPSIKDSTMVKHYSLQNGSFSVPQSGKNSSVVFSLPHAYFGENISDINVQSTNVSFGLTNDKFYNLKNYTAWTFSVGYGAPPKEGVSALIIIIIAAGLGLPVLLVIIGSILVYLWKKRRGSVQLAFGSSTYTQIQ